MAANPRAFEDIHPALWRASQLGRSPGSTVDTGYASLTAELPGGGWPCGALIELLPRAPGLGEMRLLAPALGSLNRPVALVQPLHRPNGAGLAYVGVRPENVLWLRAANTADALWSAEQILKTGSCGTLLLWQSHIRADSLRRLHLAARSTESLFFVIRPIAGAVDPSPADLRLTLEPTTDGVLVEVIKRKGPAMAQPLRIALRPGAALLSPYGRASRSVPPEPTKTLARNSVPA